MPSRHYPHVSFTWYLLYSDRVSDHGKGQVPCGMCSKCQMKNGSRAVRGGTGMHNVVPAIHQHPSPSELLGLASLPVTFICSTHGISVFVQLGV